VTRRRTFPQRHPPSQGNFHSDAGFSIPREWAVGLPLAREFAVVVDLRLAMHC
jgi:hypothetical protein